MKEKQIEKSGFGLYQINKVIKKRNVLNLNLIVIIFNKDQSQQNLIENPHKICDELPYPFSNNTFVKGKTEKGETLADKKIMRFLLLLQAAS